MICAAAPPRFERGCRLLASLIAIVLYLLLFCFGAGPFVGSSGRPDGIWITLCRASPTRTAARGSVEKGLGYPRKDSHAGLGSGYIFAVNGLQLVTRGH